MPSASSTVPPGFQKSYETVGAILANPAIADKKIHEYHVVLNADTPFGRDLTSAIAFLVYTDILLDDGSRLRLEMSRPRRAVAAEQPASLLRIDPVPSLPSKADDKTSAILELPKDGTGLTVRAYLEHLQSRDLLRYSFLSNTSPCYWHLSVVKSLTADRHLPSGAVADVQSKSNAWSKLALQKLAKHWPEGAPGGEEAISQLDGLVEDRPGKFDASTLGGSAA